MHANGWFVDPFGAHEARWFSDGRPTRLVRDADDTSFGSPPLVKWDGPLERLADANDWDGGADPRRADDGLPTPDDDLPPVDPLVAEAWTWTKRLLDVIGWFV